MKSTDIFFDSYLVEALTTKVMQIEISAGRFISIGIMSIH